MAERFARGGRLIALGASPAGALGRAPRRGRVRAPGDRRQARAAGDRARGEGGSSSGRSRCSPSPDDIVIAFGDETDGRAPASRARARLPDDRLRARSAPSGSSTPPATTRSSRQELVETLYHVLWELVHVFFEHRGLLEGRDARRRARHRRLELPLSVPRRAARHDLEAVLADVARVGADEGRRGRRRCASRRWREDARRSLARRRGAARALRRRRHAARARQRRLGDRRDGRGRRPPRRRRGGWPARPALDLTEDPAILTAIANDIGAEAIFRAR